ncbi:TIGR02594 family protein [Hymenobacter norwichensis]|uniref:TIGR02594 family protein n=1 Tax=Hymenobacter norwichensis TaxID=223903 RepID=UPI0003B53DF9|nr:TIGR02594 family protein [Hymenobacter norwichensis]
MAALPKQYQWLANEAGPRMIKEALAELGTVEKTGAANNPVILSWAKETGEKNVAQMYVADSIPWCGLFMALVAKRAEKKLVKDPLWALNWGTFGVFTKTAMLGDVLVFVRRTADGSRAGHVGLYVGEDDTAYHVLGGNQGDCVCVARMAKNRLYAARRPAYNLQPDNVRVVKLAAAGSLSHNEA